jgi:two-component system, OmpR family, sensor histidine kinase KdpD
MVMIAIADRGPGLPPGDEQRIFEKFYRARAAQNGSGVGLGLTICRGIIEAHGGRIWAENRSGGGAVFRFTLPIEKTLRSARTPTAPADDGERSSFRSEEKGS